MDLKKIRGYAFNRTRQTFLATELKIANTHLSRLRGLMFSRAHDFSFGQGLWIAPSHGVHTLGMRYAIDVVYLDEKTCIRHIEENLKPWRIGAVRLDTATVLELPAFTVFNSGTKVGDELEIVAQHEEQAT